MGVKQPKCLLEERPKRREAWQALVATLRCLRPWTFLTRHLPTDLHTYVFFGLYVLVVTYASFFMLNPHTIHQHYCLYQAIFHSVLLIATSFATLPIWAAKLDKSSIPPGLGPLALFYTFFLLGSLLVMLSGLQQEIILIFICNMIIAALCMPATSFVAMFLTALPLSWSIFKSVTGVAILSADFTFFQLQALYTWLVLGACFVVIFRFKQQYTQTKR